MMQRIAQLNGDGVCVAWVETDGGAPGIVVARDFDPLGHTWTGNGWQAPAPAAPVFTHLEFMTALGDAAVLEIMAATDPVIKLIDRKFTAASFIDLAHAETVQALQYLAGSAQVPAFGSAEYAALMAS